MADQIAGSAEFAAEHGAQGDADYVGSLYRAGLGRAADPQGSASWTSLLSSGGATRSSVLLDIATGSEAAAHLTHNLGA